MALNTDSDFYCCKCGSKGIPVCRRDGRGKEPGHLKKLFCLKCNQEVNHVECKEGGRYRKVDFDFEYKYGNFNEECLRILPYGLFRDKMYRKGVELP